MKTKLNFIAFIVNSLLLNFVINLFTNSEPKIKALNDEISNKSMEPQNLQQEL